MEKDILYNCCKETHTDVNLKIEDYSVCPLCNQVGNKVKNLTIKHLVIDEISGQIGTEDYYLCMDELCSITYYNRKLNKQFNKAQIKVPIWFKEDANPKYVCYCSKVTEEQVINAVINEGVDNMDDVLRITGAMNNPQCQRKNPLGKCCHKIIQDAIEKGLSIHDSKKFK